MRTIGMTLVVMLSLWGTSCSSSDDGGSHGSSGVAGSKPLSTLTADELGSLCDWVASLYGGYGMKKTCSDGTFSSSEDSRESCTGNPNFETCQATVSQLEACIGKVYDMCGSALGTPQCQAFLACLS